MTNRGVGATAEVMDDKFHDECGVFGIYGHKDASSLTYLGLYALQHRGQESAGIAAACNGALKLSRAMGYVGDAFNDRMLAALPGPAAIGHVRYSTFGDSRIVNAQPILIDCSHGQIALCHNGNLINAGDLAATFGAGGIDLPDEQRHGSRPAPLCEVERRHGRRTPSSSRSRRSAALSRWPCLLRTT